MNSPITGRPGIAGTQGKGNNYNPMARCPLGVCPACGMVVAERVLHDCQPKGH